MVMLMLVLTELHHVAVLRPSKLCFKAVNGEVAFVFFSKKFVVLVPDFALVPL
jgi:hypothetical protein